MTLCAECKAITEAKNAGTVAAQVTSETKNWVRDLEASGHQP